MTPSCNTITTLCYTITLVQNTITLVHNIQYNTAHDGQIHHLWQQRYPPMYSSLTNPPTDRGNCQDKSNQAQKRTSQDDNLNQKKIRKIKTIQAQKKDDRPDHRPPCTICHGHCTWAAARPVSYVSLFIYLIFLFIFLFRFRPISISAAFPVSYVFIYICYFYFHNLIGSLDFCSVQDHLKHCQRHNGPMG